jgi:hypothetical protein
MHEEATGTVAVPGCPPSPGASPAPTLTHKGKGGHDDQTTRPSLASSRSTALSTAFSDAVTMLGSMPTP